MENGHNEGPCGIRTVAGEEGQTVIPFKIIPGYFNKVLDHERIR